MFFFVVLSMLGFTCFFQFGTRSYNIKITYKYVALFTFFIRLIIDQVWVELEERKLGQVLNIILRNFHPYKLWNRQLFCFNYFVGGFLFFCFTFYCLLSLKLDPGVLNPTLISNYLTSSLWGKMMVRIMT